MFVIIRFNLFRFSRSIAPAMVQTKYTVIIYSFIVFLDQPTTWSPQNIALFSIIIDPSRLTEDPNRSSLAQPPDKPSLATASNSPETSPAAGDLINSDTLPHKKRKEESIDFLGVIRSN